MRPKLLIIILLISAIGMFSSCRKEIKKDDTKKPDNVQKNPFALHDMNTAVLQYRAMAEESIQQMDSKLQIVKQAIEKIKSERRQMQSNTVLMKTGRHSKPVIYVPADYPTLQEAINKAPQNGKIVVKGSVADIGNVAVDVPGLTIQGEGKSPLISGNILMITAANVTLQNLNINMVTAISGTNNVKLVNNEISTPDGVREEGLLFLLNANNNTIVNCTVNGIYPGGLYRYGFFVDQGSKNNSIENCIAKNTSSRPGVLDGSAFLINGENNRLKNCKALNFTRGFSSFGGYNKNNQFKSCVANNSNTDAGFVFFGTGETNLTLENCTANNNSKYGIFIDGGSSKVTNCTASSNGSPGIIVILNNFKLEKNTFKNNGYAGMYIYGDNTNGLVTGTLEKNTVQSNSDFGIYLTGVINSAITKNKSVNNPVCDFNQKDCSGNILTGNQFGTSCTGL